MLRNTEIDGVKLVNGSRGVVTAMVPAADLLADLRAQFEQSESEANAVIDDEEDDDKRVQRLRSLAQCKQLHKQITSIQEGRTSVVPMVLFRSVEDSSKPIAILPQDFTFRTRGLGENIRFQIPLMLAWAMTGALSPFGGASPIFQRGANLFAFSPPHSSQVTGDDDRPAGGAGRQILARWARLCRYQPLPEPRWFVPHWADER